MPLRVLSKSDTRHIANLTSILLAYGVLSFYYDSFVTNPMLAYISNYMLSPVYMVDYLLSYTSNLMIAGNQLGMFLVLWLCYLPFVTRLASYLIIKDYGALELKNWYYSRNQAN